jgi:hypothetical protein
MNMIAAASTRGSATDTDAQSFSDAIVTVSDRRQHYGTQLSPIPWPE